MTVLPDFENVPVKHLHPKACFVTEKPTVISTILGSCVAVTFYSPRLAIGGMCHAFLPRKSEYPNAADRSVCTFADSAVCFMLDRLQSLGADPRSLEIKMFGGGEVLQVERQISPGGQSNGWFSVGSRNARVAEETLAAAGLRVMARDVGGEAGRKIMFLSHTGGVWVRRLNRSKASTEARKRGVGAPAPSG